MKGFKITVTLENGSNLKALSTDLNEAISIFNCFTLLFNSLDSYGGGYMTLQEITQSTDEDEIIEILENCDRIWFEVVKLEKDENGKLIEVG